ncbi:hypothetical protein BDU57DRAFT_512387 [Ampelomyces quisqualis]|uniref:FAD-binding FR-type domain-containing protein n=1 Tax=Ampelomyces quisqualis TaxID=50730 RepID=A0A6A5QWX5_AMPQU|nr:hypothetical protein BDU57DRAFT_512387 [Ampelomyces quisqualis]
MLGHISRKTNSHNPVTKPASAYLKPQSLNRVESSKGLLAAFVGSVPMSEHQTVRPDKIDTNDPRMRSESHQLPHPHLSSSVSDAVPMSQTVEPFSAVDFSKTMETLASNASAEKDDILTLTERLEDNSTSINCSKLPKVRPSWPHRFCLHWLTAYRVLIALTFIANLVVLILMVRLDLPLEESLTATAANLLVSVVVRQEDLINASFDLIAKLPSNLPLSIRKFVADFHHYGGVHIGCAVSALLWYCLFIAVTTREGVRLFGQRAMTGWHWSDIATCYLFLLLIALVCLAAIPKIRELLHNSFERSHRWGGWSALALLWINSGIHTKIDATHALYKSPSIWLLAVTTFLIILPWLRIRRVAIQAHLISSREVMLTFPYKDMPPNSTSRFSLAPLKEWHAFATIPSKDGSSAAILISAAGDWTKKIIANPPSRIWIRKPAAANFLAFTPIFNSVLLVATGAGIGPMLSLLSSPAIKSMQADGKRIRVMWCVYDPNAPHWAFVQTAIRNVDPMPKIFDSKQGRPDIAFEARHLAHKHELEAVMIVSNKKVTNDVVREVKAHGGAAYGAVFDS